MADAMNTTVIFLYLPGKVVSVDSREPERSKIR